MKNLFVVPLLILFVGFTSCSKDSEDDKGTEAEAAGEISSFEDVELKLVDSESEEFGIAFSSTTGLTYKRSEVTTDNVGDIHLASFANQAFIAFNSPDQDTVIKEIEGATSTKIQLANVEMTAEQFDLIKDDTLLKDLNVVNDNESQPISYKGVVLFETAEGKIGALKIKLINADRISFDVKVIK